MTSSMASCDACAVMATKSPSNIPYIHIHTQHVVTMVTNILTDVLSEISVKSTSKTSHHNEITRATSHAHQPGAMVM